jgi:hypothetical protein
MWYNHLTRFNLNFNEAGDNFGYPRQLNPAEARHLRRISFEYTYGIKSQMSCFCELQCLRL